MSGKDKSLGCIVKYVEVYNCTATHSLSVIIDMQIITKMEIHTPLLHILSTPTDILSCRKIHIFVKVLSYSIIIITCITNMEVVIGGSNLDICCTTTEYPIQVKV